MADYNINDVTRRVQYTGNTGTGPFAFSFEILTETDVAVYKNTTLLTLTTDYTVTINANGTGSITLTGSGNGTALISSDVLTIIGARNLERTTDFVTGGDLLASSLNEQLDSQVVMLQQLDEKLARSLRYDSFDQFTSAVMPAKADRLGKYLQFNSTTGDPEAGPDSTDVTTLADIATDIATLADIEDGTDATDAIQTVAGISSNVTTVAGISSNVTSVAGNASNINTVAADGTDIGTVATNIADVNTVAGISANVTSVAGNETNINTVAADGTDIGTVATNIASVNTTATNIADVNTCATDIAAIIAAPTEASNAAASAATATTKAGEASASASSAASAQTAAETARDQTLTAFDDFDDRYLGQKASDPTVDNDGDALVAGALYFNTTDDVMKVYEGSVWVAAYASLSGALLVANNLSDLGDASAARTNLGLGTAATTASTDYVAVTGDTMTGNLSFGDNDKAIFGAGSDLEIYHTGSASIIRDSGTGSLYIDGSSEIFLRGQSGFSNMIKAIDGAEVELYHNNALKLETTSTGVDITGTVTATTVDLGDWTITESAGVLYFATGGTNKMKLDASGNLTVVGDVTAFGTI